MVIDFGGVGCLFVWFVFDLVFFCIFDWGMVCVFVVGIGYYVGILIVVFCVCGVIDV